MKPARERNLLCLCIVTTIRRIRFGHILHRLAGILYIKVLPQTVGVNAADFSLASGEPREVYLEEVGMYVMGVPHKPWYKDGHWYVDIAIPRLGQNVYSPFLRLAVARYQPNTIKDINPLSSVVMTNMVQLLPERTLFIRVDGNKVLIKLRGIGPYSDYYPNQWRVFFREISVSSRN